MDHRVKGRCEVCGTTSRESEYLGLALFAHGLDD